MPGDWPEHASRELAGLARPAGAWAYRRGGSPSVEPTALAALALLARTPENPPPAAAAAAAWLLSAQQPDGSLGLSPSQPTLGWTTPLAVLLWHALRSDDAPARRACDWLLAQKGQTLPRSEDPGNVAGHDTTLVGWPWVVDTHSWLEPTALAVLALGVAGRAGHPRVTEGLRLIRNRAVEGGGWNYGNRAVFGRPLRAQPGPTGLALIALAALDRRTPEVDHAIAYLEATLPGVRAPLSLGWGLLGLRAWGVRTGRAADWLAEAWADVDGRPDAAPRLALLLLADAPDSLRLLGCPRKVSDPGPSAGTAGVEATHE